MSHENQRSQVVKPWEKPPLLKDKIDNQVVEVFPQNTSLPDLQVNKSVIAYLSDNKTLVNDQQKIARMEASFRSKSHINFRKAFVVQYIQDFDGPGAVSRMLPNKNRRYCTDTARRMLSCGYVSLLVTMYLKEVEATSVVQQSEIVADLVKQARYYGEGSSHGARVAALKELAKITGLSIDKKLNVNYDATKDEKLVLTEKQENDFLAKFKGVIEGTVARN